MRKGQESVGLMIMVGLALMVFLLFTGIINTDLNTALNIETLTKLRVINEKIARAINHVYLSGPGTMMNVTLEELNTNYTIFVRPGNVVIEHYLGVNTNSISAYMVEETMIYNGTYTVKNDNGVIKIE